MKVLPNVGDKLYLRQFTGNYDVDMVKRPYTVVEVSPSKVVVQRCKMIPPIYHCCGNPYLDRPDLEGQRVWFFDTIAEEILPDPYGEKEELTWHSHREMWGTPGRDQDYPQYAIFGEYKHYPYMN